MARKRAHHGFVLDEFCVAARITAILDAKLPPFASGVPCRALQWSLPTQRFRLITALVLARLAEIDARGAYRQWACATLVSYCVYELRLSEDEAQRRCRAAQVARQFPMLFEMLAEASIHLTGIVLLAPHLTPENHVELLGRARYRTKRELEKLVAQIAPRSDVPNVIEPLGPADDGFRRQAPMAPWSMALQAT